MTLPVWNPPAKILPSDTYLGETSKTVLHEAVGNALNEWEQVESILAVIFGLLVESRSGAALRAYGTILAQKTRRDALESAAIEFFRGKTDPKKADFDALFKAYGDTIKYRNNIAHGICYGQVSVGRTPTTWFLYPPQYNTNRRSGPNNKDSSYIYKASDILHCKDRFSQLAEEATVLEVYLRASYPL